MLGGLYGDLPPPSSVGLADEDGDANHHPYRGATSAASMWSSSSTKMAPSTLRKPSSSLFAAPPSVLRNQTSLPKPKPLPLAVASLSALGSSAAASRASVPSIWSADHGVGGVSPLVTGMEAPSPPFQPALVGASAAVLEEYDPARPNDYDEYCRGRRRVKMEEEMRKEMERRHEEEEERERERERELIREHELENEMENERDEELQIPLHVSGEEAWKRRAMLSASRGGAAMETGSVKAKSPSPPRDAEGFTMNKLGGAGLGLGAGGHMTAAQRMMARMGWKEGQGLGKQEQGITTPLMARKTDKRAGVIVNAGEAKADKKQKSGVSLSGPPTRVVLLRNMVGPGEVDDDLEDEVASECTKYGTVTRVLIFEITEPNFPATETVRIFIQFERAEQATKALVDLDGRFFGGRVVRASFYDEERFSRNELAPMPNEVPVITDST